MQSTGPLPSSGKHCVCGHELKPSHAHSVSHTHGSVTHCDAFHVNTTCLSFVTAFALAADKLQLPDVKRVLVVAAEVASKGVGPENWETLTLFGDGAAAVSSCKTMAGMTCP